MKVEYSAKSEFLVEKMMRLLEDLGLWNDSISWEVYDQFLDKWCQWEDSDVWKCGNDSSKWKITKSTSK